MHKTAPKIGKCSVQQRAQNAKLYQPHEHAIRANELTRILQTKPDTCRGTAQLCRHKTEKRERRAKAQADKDHGRTGRDDDLKKLPRPAGPQRTGGPNIGAGHIGRARVGVQPDCQEHGVGDHEIL